MDSIATRFNRALNDQKPIIFIFDIDSTIFNVSPRNQHIADLFFDTLPELKKETKQTQPLAPTDWGIEPYLAALNSEHSRDLAKKFWARHFFAGTFLHSDAPYKGILDFFKYFESYNVSFFYLTGRDHTRMRRGTLEQLQYWDLPVSETNLITKPHKSHLDQNYKNKEIQQLLSKHPQHSVFFFENEPMVFDSAQFPEKENYTPVFIDSTHSGRLKPSPNWITQSAFKYTELLEDIQHLQGKKK